MTQKKCVLFTCDQKWSFFVFFREYREKEENSMDCFTLGSIVSVKTMHDDLIEGQVMAFDLNTKLLILSKYFYEFHVMFIFSLAR